MRAAMPMLQTDEKKKTLRTVMMPGEYIFMLLMPISQIIAWALVMGPRFGIAVNYPFKDVVFGLTMFYGVWALKNRFLSNSMERGYCVHLDRSEPQSPLERTEQV